MVDDCYFLVKGGVENSYGKVNILLQTFISRGYVDSFSLVSDLGYVAQVESSLQVAIQASVSLNTRRLNRVSTCGHVIFCSLYRHR